MEKPEGLSPEAIKKAEIARAEERRQRAEQRDESRLRKSIKAPEVILDDDKGPVRGAVPSVSTDTHYGSVYTTGKGVVTYSNPNERRK